MDINTINSVARDSHSLISAPQLTKQQDREQLTTTNTAPQDTQQHEPISAEQVESAVDQLQKFTQSLAKNLEFSIDEDTGIRIVKIIDPQTEETIRQIPSEKAVAISRSLDQIRGLLFSDQA